MLRVVGVGGAGVNAVNRMVEAEIEGVEFLAINTDLQSLQQSAAHETLHIGDSITRGLGSGSNPDLGRAAAREEYDRIKALLRGSDMVFIAAGAGGGTGTGAAPIVAHIARELGALTVGIVTRPFQFEGTRRREQAEAGIDALADEVDTLIVVPNNRLLSVLDRNVSMVEAFRVADDVLRQGVQGISDLVTLPGLINLDFADVRTIMSDAGNALLGIGMGTGERRAIDAAEQAVASPLLETSMEGARSILLSITGGRDLSLWEVNEAAKAVAEAAHPDANIIFGAMVDDKLDDQVWVTVVATGYGNGRAPSGGPRREPAPGAKSRDAREPRVSRGRAASRSLELDVPSSSRALTCYTGAWRRPRSLVRSTRRSLRALTHAWFSSARVGAMAAQLGVIAAGHPVTARTGAEVLREGGNAVDAALGAMLASFACEPLLTGLGAGGYMLVVTPDSHPVLLDFFVEAPGPGRGPGRRAELIPISVSFGDAIQIFNIGAASVGTYGMPAGSGEALGALRPHPAGRRWSAPAAALARDGVELNAAAGLRHRDPRGHRARDAGVRGAVRARRRLLRAGDADPPARARRRARAARVPRAPPRSTPATSRRRSSTGWPSAAGMLTRGSRRLPRSSTALRCAPLPRPRGADQPAAVGRRDPDRARAGAARCRRRAARPSSGWSRRWSARRTSARPSSSRASTTPSSCSGFLRRRRPARVDHPHRGARPRRLGMLGDVLQRLLLGRDRPRHRRAPQQHARRAGPQPARLSPPSGRPADAEHDGADDRAARRRPELVLGSAGSNRIRSAILQTIVRRVDDGLRPARRSRAPRVHFEDGVVYAEPGIDIGRAGGAGPRDRPLPRAQPVLRRRAGRRARPSGEFWGGGDPRRGGAAIVVRV